jgi:hypothetical protein
MTYGKGVCRPKLLSRPPPSSLRLPLPVSEFEFEIELPSRLVNLFKARLVPPPILPGPLPLRAGRLRDVVLLPAPILAEPLD